MEYACSRLLAICSYYCVVLCIRVSWLVSLALMYKLTHAKQDAHPTGIDYIPRLRGQLLDYITARYPDDKSFSKMRKEQLYAIFFSIARSRL